MEMILAGHCHALWLVQWSNLLNQLVKAADLYNQVQFLDESLT